MHRETERGTGAYDGWIRDGTLADAVRTFHGWVGESPAVGFLVDSTGQSAEETVDWIMDHWDEAVV